jgi:hypothetical protein
MLFEVFTAVTMKNAVFWDVAPCGSQAFRRNVSLPFSRGISVCYLLLTFAFLSSVILSILKMKATGSSKMAFITIDTRRYNPYFL